jgi:peptidoglycan/xylan/chitin deacetylase (PgdA/CDA1 family)
VLRNPGKPVLITIDDGYIDTYEIAVPTLKEYGFSAVISCVADLSRRSVWWDAEKGIPSGELMRAEHLKELSVAGMEIASHSVSHPHLPQLDERSARYELAESKSVLEDLLGKEVRIFTYPYGETTKWIKQIAEDVGYRYAFAVYTGPIRFGSDLYEIRRVLMKDSTNPGYLASSLLGFRAAKGWGVSKIREFLRPAQRTL